MTEQSRSSHTAERSKSTQKTWPIRLLCISLILVLISCIGASLLQTDFGNVEITKIKVPTDNGKWISGNLFRPKSASAENKVPLVITSHGYLNNNQMQDITAIELSRRGIAVIAMDAYYHGDSSPSNYSYNDTTIAEGMGMIPLVEFAYSNLDYVDNTKIGVTGHSMGGSNTWNTARYYGRQYNEAIAAAQAPGSDGGAEITAAEQAAADAVNKVAAAFPVSQIRASTQESMQEIHCNFGSNFGFFDEGAYRCVNGDGDLHDAPEAMYIINSVLPDNQKMDSTVEIGKMYGNPDNGTLRVVYNPKEIHPWQHFSVQSSRHMTDFFTAAFQMENPIPSANQTWLLKELFNLLGLIGSFLLIVPAAVLLLKVPVFASLKTPVPQKLPALTDKKSKLFFWGSWVFSWVISWLSFIPIGKLDQYIFPAVTDRGVSSWFPQPTTNFILLWAVFNGIVGILLFWLTYRFRGSKNGISPEMWGIKISVREFLKTFVLASCIFTAFYALVMFADYFFHTDFRIWTLDIRAFTADKLYVAFQYWPLFFIFYAANSIAVNSANRIEGQKEWFNLFICGLGNSLGVIILNLIQYGTVFLTGVPHWQADWLRPLVIVPLIIQLFAAAYISRYLFKATGKVWLGAMVNTMIIVMMGVANTATFLPLK